MEYIIGGIAIALLLGFWKRGRTVFIEAVRHPLQSTDIDVSKEGVKITRHQKMPV